MSFSKALVFLIGLFLAYGLFLGITAVSVILYIFMGLGTICFIIIAVALPHQKTKMDLGKHFKTSTFVLAAINTSAYIVAALLAGNLVFLYFYIPYCILAWICLLRLAWVNKGLPDAVLP